MKINFYLRKRFGPYLMQTNLQKNIKEPVALVTPCFWYEEVCRELSLYCILIVFVVWICYNNFEFDVIKVSTVSSVLRQFFGVRTFTSASLLAALNLYHHDIKLIFSMVILTVVQKCTKHYFSL